MTFRAPPCILSAFKWYITMASYISDLMYSVFYTLRSELAGLPDIWLN